MKEYTVSLFGHRIIENWDSVEFYLGKIVRKLAEQYECLLFLMGRDGDFDRIAASVIHKLIKCLSCDISITWVMAYQRAEYTKNVFEFEEYYSSVEICCEASLAHPKAAIQIRNRSMVDRSDLVVFWVEKKAGGAYRTMSYARKKEIPFINLAEKQSL